jgi:hypothetical protein
MIEASASPYPSTYIDPQSPIFNEIQVEVPPPPKYSGLVRGDSAFTPRTDLPTPLTADESALISALLALDIPQDDRNTYRGKANSLVGCGRLVRRAECPHGDEIRIYYVFCGQGTLCRRCGGGKARTQALKYNSPDLYRLIDSERCDVQTFSLEVGTKCYTENELAGRVRLCKTLWRALRTAIDQELEIREYGAKMSVTLNPLLHRLEFCVLWQNMPLPLVKIKKLWERVCSRHYNAIARKLLEARGMVLFGNKKSDFILQAIGYGAMVSLQMPDIEHFLAKVISQRFEIGSAAKALRLLLSGNETLLLFSAKDRLPYALAVADEHTTSVCGIFRGRKLKKATEWIPVDESVNESSIPPELSKHGACSVHHEPLVMTSHAAATIDELERKFSRIYFGPITVYRDKAWQEIKKGPTATPSPPS